MADHERLDPEIAGHYAEVSERQRLGPLSTDHLWVAGPTYPRVRILIGAPHDHATERRSR